MGMGNRYPEAQPMHLCVINNILHDEQEIPAHQAMLEGCAQGMLGPGTAVNIRGLRHAPLTSQTAPDCYRDSFFQLLSTVQIVYAVMAAAREGFDAIVVNCFDDYGVEQARSVVDVPVIGIGSASLFRAAALAPKLGLIVPNLPGQVEFAARQIADLGLTHALIDQGIRMDALPFAEAWMQSLQDPALAVARFAPLARALVEDGAGCVVFGCGGFSLVCGAQRFSTVQANGREWPVLIPVTVALQEAESQVLAARAGTVVTARRPGSVLHGAAELKQLLADFGMPPLE
jgi:allantoin racemase